LLSTVWFQERTRA